MHTATRWMMTLGVTGALVLSSTVVTAQDVRTFDDQVDADEEMEVAVPGAPAPQQDPPEPQVVEQEADADQEDGEAGPPGFHQVHMQGQTGTPGAAPVPGGVLPQELLEREENELYQGVIPGQRDDVDHLRALKEEAGDDPTVITWVGFRPEDDRTRVFFQSPQPVQYQVDEVRDGNQLSVTFERATIPERNFTRFIDASHFDRAVERIEVEELGGGDVEVTLQLNEDLVPATTIDGQYLYLDFPHEEPELDDATADAE